MVIDTSAPVAILLGEPDAKLFAEALEAAPVRLVSAVTRVELSFVIEGRKGSAGRTDLELMLRDGSFDIVSVTPRQADIAIDAFRRFGRGRHRAGLAIGECFSYALAMASGHPLLFKGDDFMRTDLRPALPTAGSPGAWSPEVVPHLSTNHGCAKGPCVVQVVPGMIRPHIAALVAGKRSHGPDDVFVCDGKLCADAAHAVGIA